MKVLVSVYRYRAEWGISSIPRAEKLTSCGDGLGSTGGSTARQEGLAQYEDYSIRYTPLIWGRQPPSRGGP